MALRRSANRLSGENHQPQGLLEDGRGRTSGLTLLGVASPSLSQTKGEIVSALSLA
jgi:hypothetical protein